jgi:hypothetical protein
MWSTLSKFTWQSFFHFNDSLFYINSPRSPALDDLSQFYHNRCVIQIQIKKHVQNPLRDYLFNSLFSDNLTKLNYSRLLAGPQSGSQVPWMGLGYMGPGPGIIWDKGEETQDKGGGTRERGHKMVDPVVPWNYKRDQRTGQLGPVGPRVPWGLDSCDRAVGCG